MNPNPEPENPPARTELESVNELFRLLTEHEVPDCYEIGNLPPKMTGKQAFGLIWFLQERIRCLPDHIEICDACDHIGDSWGEHFEYIESKEQRLCESCYRAEHAFQCCKCDNHDCHEAPGRVAVLTKPEGNLKPGLYRITSWPFYADGMIEGFLFDHAFKRVGKVPEGVDTEDYPLGFLCQTCEAPLSKPVTSHRRARTEDR